ADRPGDGVHVGAGRGVAEREAHIQTVDSSWQAVRTETEVDSDYGLPVQVQTEVVKPNSSACEPCAL
ncbi:hypothetical protein, partial [Streptomyces sp. NPDC058424]|uniref:hypothetical protein n=1 Tax=Streptomyces sp. NPDC058424 TaxID=3346491 RepID=UPI0036542FEA